MAQVINGNGNGIEQPKYSNENGMESTSKQTENVWGIPIEAKDPGAQESKIDPDASTREIDWAIWDSPVWCSRFARFENREDAAVDDGYTIKGQPPYQGTSLE